MSTAPPPGPPSADTSVTLNRLAKVGFWCSLFTLVLLVAIVALEASGVAFPGFLLWIGFVTLVAGFAFSLVGLIKRRRIDRQNHRLAVAGLVMSALVTVAIPILIFLVIAAAINDLFT